MSILEELADYDGKRGRIVSFKLSDSREYITLREECDGYFTVELDKEDFGKMISELQTLHAKMI